MYRYIQSKMIPLLLILLCASVCQAVPIWISRYNHSPMPFHFIRQPSVSFGFGSGFSGDIGGYRHSSGVGTAFQSGNGQAYGFGVADGGNTGAFARAVVSPPTSIFPYYNTVPVAYLPSNTASASASAQRFNGLSSASSSSSTANGYQNAAATSSANFLRYFPFPGHNLAVASAQNINGQKSTFSMSQLQNGSGFKSAVSLANDFGGVKSTMAQTTQMQGADVQHSGATSITAPGFQNAQSHAFGNGNYY